jgi:hypothetical protein
LEPGTWLRIYATMADIVRGMAISIEGEAAAELETE